MAARPGGRRASVEEKAEGREVFCLRATGRRRLDVGDAEGQKCMDSAPDGNDEELEVISLGHNGCTETDTANQCEEGDDKVLQSSTLGRRRRSAGARARACGCRGRSTTRQVAIRLHVSVTERLVEAGDDRNQLLFGVHRLSHRQYYGHCQVDRLLVKIVGENNVSVTQSRGTRKDTVESGHSLRSSDNARLNLPVIGVKGLCGRERGPNDRSEVEQLADVSDTVIDVTVGRSHGVGRDTRDTANDLFRPSELQQNLLVRLCCQSSVGPGVNRELVTFHVLVLQHVWPRDSSRTNDKEGRFDITVLLEVVEKLRCVWRRTIVVRDTPGVFVWALGDVVIRLVSTAGPPMVCSSVGEVVGVRCTRCLVHRLRDLGRLSELTGVLLKPGLCLWRIRRWDFVKCREVGGAGSRDSWQCWCTADERIDLPSGER